MMGAVKYSKNSIGLDSIRLIYFNSVYCPDLA